MPRIRIALALAFSVCLLACHDSGGGGGGSARTSSFGFESARSWMDQVNAAVVAEGKNPPEASRLLAYASVAFYEGVVGGMPDYRSLVGQVNGLNALPAPPAGRLHWPAVANAATADVLAHLLATASAPTLQAIADLETQLEGDFALDTDAATLDRSRTYGEDLAAALNDWADDDGYALWNDCSWTAPVGEGLWVPTPPAFVANPIEPCWGKLRPFVLLFGAECAPLPHPGYSTLAGSAFHLEAQEVYDTGNNLTTEQLDIARFWADGAGTLTPPGHWANITGQILEQEDLSLDVAAEAYARIGLGMADAFISCWEMKFFYNLLRPVTYIRDPAGPIADAAWSSSIGTPPFPEYTSGHSTQSGAASFLLSDLLGAIPFTDHTHDAVPLTARSFDTFEEAAGEAAISRLYGGIHYRSAIEHGLDQGRCIGRMVRDNVVFREPAP